ncbi:MAG: FecR family protein [Mangrovibacterium sp.]
MDNKINDNAFLNYFSGKYSYNDYLKVKDWLSNPQSNNGIRTLLVKQWDAFIDQYKGKRSFSDQVFKNIHYSILLEEKSLGTGKGIWSRYRQIAAVLLIPVLLFLLWDHLSPNSFRFSSQTEDMEQDFVEVNAPEGSRVRFCLPDGSCGWLNSGGKLKYRAAFAQNRKVELTGEAYFEVKRREQSGFIVSVPDMDVQVTGTKFNVSAYSDDHFTSVVLKEGKINVTGRKEDFSYTLHPDEKVTFDHQTRSIKVANVDAGRYTAWTEGYLIIEDERLEQIAVSLERWYNADVDIIGEKLKNYRFRATFREEPLEEVLRLIAKSTPIQYSISQREIDSNGVFKKRRITIISRY